MGTRRLTAILFACTMLVPASARLAEADGFYYRINKQVFGSQSGQPLVDTDGDGIPNTTDPDDDNDGVPDASDPFPLDPTKPGNPATNPGNPTPPTDTDGDGIPDSTDPDDDNDGVPDASDPFPLDPTKPGTQPAPTDTDGDGTPDSTDDDDDNDGVPDASDPFPLDPTKPGTPAPANPFAIRSMQADPISGSSGGTGDVAVDSDKTATLAWNKADLDDIAAKNPGVTTTLSGNTATIRVSATCGMSYVLSPNGTNAWTYSRTPLSGSTCKMNGPPALEAKTGDGTSPTGDAKILAGTRYWAEKVYGGPVRIVNVSSGPFTHKRGPDNTTRTGYRICFDIEGGTGNYSSSVDVFDPEAPNTFGGDEPGDFWSNLTYFYYSDYLLKATMMPESFFDFSANGYQYDYDGGDGDNDGYPDNEHNTYPDGDTSSDGRLCAVIDEYDSAANPNQIQFYAKVSDYPKDGDSEPTFASTNIVIPYHWNGN